VEPSNNANLMAVGGLVISGITLAPAFDPAIMSYTASADSSVPSVTVTATRADSGASIQVKVNSGSFTAITSGTPTGALILDNPAGMNTISVLVTAADTVTTKTYVVTIAKTVLVTINANTNGTVNLPGSVERTPGSPLAVTSIPDAGYRFKSWSGDIGYLSPPTSATTTLNVPISAVTTVTANFELDIFADGDGTAGDPFHITTLAHLIDMNSYRDKAFVLMANIDLISQPNWLPIGDTTTKFTGRFDGNGYTLSNLTINVTFDENRGLFGFTNGAIISNVTLSSINFSSTYNYAGGLIGRTTGNTQVTDCSVQGTISAYQSTGGLIGYSDSGSTLAVLRCSSAVTITSAYTGGLGGLIGRTEGGSVSQSSATGNLVGHVAGTQNYTGGLIGWNQNTSVIDSYATGMVDGDDGTGGLIGYNTGSSSVTNCYSAGAVTGTANIGGLIGYDSGTTITSAYYDQTASGRNDTGKGEPLLTTDMQNSATVGTIYPGWNFSTIWEILLTAYPTFK